MGSCYSDDHIAEDRINMDITTCNIKEPEPRTEVPPWKRSVINYWRGGGGA